jgi:hypothetical protein
VMSSDIEDGCLGTSWTVLAVAGAVFHWFW